MSELNSRPPKRCYSAIYLNKETSTSWDFRKWYINEKWLPAERKAENGKPMYTHYIQSLLRGADPWDEQKQYVNLLKGHQKLMGKCLLSYWKWIEAF